MSAPAKILRFLLIFGLILSYAELGTGETFLINGGGAVEGTLLNPNGRPVRIEIKPGLTLSLEPKTIQGKIKDEKEQLALYNQVAPLQSDTVENHLEIAAFCKEHYLVDLERVHLNRVLELAPDHEPTRLKLGFFKDKRTGQWTTREEKQSQRGYILHKGNWMIPQAVWIAEKNETQKKATEQWKKEIKKIGSSLGNYEVRQRLVKIDDPLAAGPITVALKDENNPDFRILYLRALGNIGTTNALREIARCYMYDNIESVRGTCLDLIRRNPQHIPLVGAYFSDFLLSSNSDGTRKNSLEMLSRAAYGIGEIGDRGSVGALIDSLIVEHKETIVVGSTGTSVGSNPMGVGYSQGVRTRHELRTNNLPAAMDALKKLTGENYQYDINRWKTWMLQRNKPVPFNARRG